MPPLKDRKDWTLIGTPQKRVDTPTKVNGKTIYGIDVQIPGMKIASVAMCPVMGGKLAKLDDAAARKIPGVVDVLRIDDGVAVVGDHFWAAQQGLEALDIDWDLGPEREPQSGRHREGTCGCVRRPTGSLPGRKAIPMPQSPAPRSSSTAVYQLPFLAHAPMEPINCTVHVRPDGVDVWCGTQVPGTRAGGGGARSAGLPAERVAVHNHMIGGGFGRRLEAEYVGIAAAFAKQVSYPLKMIWTRETDIQRDRYRPYYYDHIAAGLDANGKIVGWTHKVTGSSVMARWAPPGHAQERHRSRRGRMRGGPDLRYPEAISVSWVRHEPPGLVTAWWRGVGPAHNMFVVESFIDELAHAAKQDPVAFRRSLLRKSRAPWACWSSGRGEVRLGHATAGRCRRAASWCSRPSARSCPSSARCGGDGGSEIRLRRIVAAMDCGQAINPDSVRAQLEGGLVFGMTAALYSEITLDHGRVQQGNFNNYRMLRMDETPPIEVHIVDSTEKPGGLGETGTAAAFPAVANAVFAATGKRVRVLPLARGLVSGA